MTDDIEKLLKEFGPSEMVKKSRVFKEKYNKQAFTYRNPDERFHRAILNDLALAVHEFEIAEEKFSNDMKGWDYSSRVENLNKIINECYASEIIEDNIRLKQLEECQKKHSELEKLNDISKNVIKQLTKEKMDLQTRIDNIYKKYPKIKEDVDIPESELTDG